MGAIDAVVVAIPAHNEAEWIRPCLESLGQAIARVPVPVRVRVVLDACQDDTASRLPDWVECRQVRCRRVGAARAAGFADLVDDLAAGKGAGQRVWLATTDADSQVPADWLTAQLRSAAEHDLFVGTIRLADPAGRPPGLLAQHEAGYHRGPGHRHIHGANLGLSLATYRRLGGFRPLGVHEDVELVRAGLAAGVRVDWSAEAPVLTSARRSTRTPGGFAAALDALEQRLRQPEPRLRWA